MATRYGLEGPGIKSRRSESFRSRPVGPWGPTSLIYKEYQIITRDKAAQAWG